MASVPRCPWSVASSRRRGDRRVLVLPAEPRLRRTPDRLRGGSNASSGVGRDAAGERPL